MPPPKLLDQVRERIRVKHYSLRTEEAYLHWIRRFIVFHGKRHPRQIRRCAREAHAARSGGSHAERGAGTPRAARRHEMAGGSGCAALSTASRKPVRDTGASRRLRHEQGDAPEALRELLDLSADASRRDCAGGGWGLTNRSARRPGWGCQGRGTQSDSKSWQGFGARRRLIQDPGFLCEPLRILCAPLRSTQRVRFPAA